LCAYKANKRIFYFWHEHCVKIGSSAKHK
jgi:hypothetical protein